nr:hypothetical protein [Anaerolineae bacterium]
SHPDLESDLRMLEQVKRERAGEAAPVQTLPADQVDQLVQSTIAVKTFASDKLGVWRNDLVRNSAIAQQHNMTHEFEFFNALIAILDDQPVTMPTDHPYISHVGRVIDVIASDQTAS